MTAKRKITDKNGVQVFPITHTKAVLDDNGNSVEQRLQEQMDVINQKQFEVGAVPSDVTPTEGSTNWVTSGGVYNEFAGIKEETEIISLYRTAAFESSGTSQQYVQPGSFIAGDYIVEVDTPETEGVTMIVKLRQGVDNTTAVNISNIPMDGETHKYYVTTTVTMTRVYLWSFSQQGEYGQVTVRICQKVADYTRLDAIPYDVSVYHDSEIYTLSEAIAAIPEEKQQVGMMIRFINPNKEYSIYRYLGGTVAGITNKDMWSLVGSSDSEDSGGLIINIEGNYTMNECLIVADEASADFGVAVAQASAVWATPHIKCKGYDYLYVTLYPSITEQFYNSGCVFYDESGQAIHGYGSKAFEASSANNTNPYPFPRCLEIPANAVTFRTTYRKNYYPSLKLINGEWDNIPLGVRYTAEYYGERIGVKKPHKVYLTHWTRYTSGLSTNQAGCAYGDYLFLFGKENRFSVVDFSDPTGAVKVPIQANIEIPDMKTSDGTTVIHNDAVGFSNIFYDADDEFPLLCCGGGYANNDTVSTYFYVLRIVKTDDGNGTVTFTPTVVQEITVITGLPRPTHNSCLNFYYDTDRGKIIVSGKRHTWITKYNISATGGDFTIDLRDADSYTQHFYESAGSGSYYNNHLFAANEITGDGVQRFGLRVMNVITGEFQIIPLARHNEPEAVFALNNELYVLEVGSVFKLYFD